MSRMVGVDLGGLVVGLGCGDRLRAWCRAAVVPWAEAGTVRSDRVDFTAGGVR